MRLRIPLLVLVLLATTRFTHAATAGKSGDDDLVVATAGRTAAAVVVSPDAGEFEKRAADDLVKYVGLMTGARPKLLNTRADVDAALEGKTPLLIVGEEALRVDPSLRTSVAGVLKKKPYLRADGIGLRRAGRRVLVAGNNDRSHYFAVAELLRQWGCRWYFPTEFGEVVPDERELKVGELDFVSSSPFEIRSYWISWVGDSSGAEEFQLRNMMTGRGDLPPTGHALGKYTKGVGKGTFHFPITSPKTADHVAAKVAETYAAGKNFSLGMEDGSYDSDDPRDKELMKLQWDKYFLRWSVTDPMLELYNNVARRLAKQHPDSQARIGFLAYANMTLPPVRDMRAEPSLFCELAPIDIDPVHGMDDPRSPPRREYRAMLEKWAKVMDGRLCIYDYDQGMLVWRDVPAPSHQAFRQDVQHYRRNGVLGVNTESRNAIATVWLNLHLRARLLWNPDEDVDALLDEFYTGFYGPAAEPMKTYWTAIFEAWEETIVTEHEYFVAQAVYTPELLKTLKAHLADAEQVANRLQVRGSALSRNEKLYVQRLRVARLMDDILQGYMAMVHAAATECDYATAVKYGEQALARRDELTDTSGIFTTYRGYNVEKRGYAWWPGEVKQYRELQPFVDGTQGQLIAKLPVEWAFHRDDDGKGLERGFATKPVDLTYWNEHRDEQTLDARKDYPDEWETLRTDLYAQAQGILHPDRQSYTGHLWYRTEVDLTAADTKGSPHLRFPGLFNECRLYVNGKEVAHREQGKMWWLNDYRFEWDVDLTGKLKPGENTITLQCHCEHHFGGMFRRPFLYERLTEAK